MQEFKSKEIYSKIADGSVSRLIAVMQVKTFGFNGNTVKLIPDSATIENLIKTIL